MSSKTKAVNIREQCGLLTLRSFRYSRQVFAETLLQQNKASSAVSSSRIRTQLSHWMHSQLTAAVHGDGIELLMLVTGQPDV